MLRREGPLDAAAAIHVLGGGLTISLSVITGLPAVLAALWLAIRPSGTPFADYLALALDAVEKCRDRPRRADHPGHGMGVVVARDGAGIGARVHDGCHEDRRAPTAPVAPGDRICVAAPVTEEFFARGFLFRGWSKSFLKVPGAILLSSLVWTALHLQYDWYFFGEVFSIGLLLGYLRYRYRSTWLTVIVHGANNLAAVVQTFLLVSSG